MISVLALAVEKIDYQLVVISQVRGMYGIYCTEARGPCARGLRPLNAMHPECA